MGAFVPPSPVAQPHGMAGGAALWGMLRVAAAEMPGTAFTAADASAAAPRWARMRGAPSADGELHGRLDHAGVQLCPRLLRAGLSSQRMSGVGAAQVRGAPFITCRSAHGFQ